VTAGEHITGPVGLREVSVAATLVDAATVLRARLRRPGMVPGFLVIGGKRCGSTSLTSWIFQHPDVAPCRTAKGTHYFDVHHNRGWRWYRSAFPPVGAGQVTGEGSPYYSFHPASLDWIASELPGVKLLLVLREPSARAYSHYNYNVKRGLEDLPFEQALDVEGERLAGEDVRLLADPEYPAWNFRHFGYLTRGHYDDHVANVLARFPADQLMVVKSEALFADPTRQLARVWTYLGLRDVTLEGLTAHKQMQYHEPIPELVRGRLSEYYAPRLVRLYGSPAVDFTWPEAAA
jgi:hypothetical protein